MANVFTFPSWAWERLVASSAEQLTCPSEYNLVNEWKKLKADR